VRTASTPVLTGRYAVRAGADGIDGIDGIDESGADRAMRKYHDRIEVRRGLIAGQEVPTEFLWRDKLWVVREVISHWVESGAWWEQAGVAALFGVAAARAGGVVAAGSDAHNALGVDLLGEREYWRVEARRGRAVLGAGVFDLAYDLADGRWHLVCALD
jgi:hypothetical protein